jgi:hypothetical protein
MAVLPSIPNETGRRSCSGCHAGIDARIWRALPLVNTIRGKDLERVLVVEVPWTVEVRRCGCGALVASLEPPTVRATLPADSVVEEHGDTLDDSLACVSNTVGSGCR